MTANHPTDAGFETRQIGWDKSNPAWVARYSPYHCGKRSKVGAKDAVIDGVHVTGRIVSCPVCNLKWCSPNLGD